ncbi:hypothetical protein [Roseomonas sp. 18066]|uniref:DUF3309 family protein n=1 Tax=Roseomonas sp. 18066 TaxID=2681412 RepID=UPI00135856D2|nr:hypothetical protein [Roseomonas sp. 18066]
MITYIVTVVVVLAALAALPLWHSQGFDAPPVAMWGLLAVAAVVMIFRGRKD